MKCPICGNETVRKSVAIMVANVCEHCQGVWFSPGDLEEVLDSKLPVGHLVTLPGKAQIQPPEQRVIHCPVCTGNVHLAKMKTHATSKVDVNACTVCHGKWVYGKGLVNLVEYCRPRGLKALLEKLFAPKPAAQTSAAVETEKEPVES